MRHVVDAVDRAGIDRYRYVLSRVAALLVHARLAKVIFHEEGVLGDARAVLAAYTRLLVHIGHAREHGLLGLLVEL